MKDLATKKIRAYGGFRLLRANVIYYGCIYFKPQHNVYQILSADITIGSYKIQDNALDKSSSSMYLCRHLMAKSFTKILQCG